MAKLYGWGASIVIVGALFKIQHYPGAGLMLDLDLGLKHLYFSCLRLNHNTLNLIGV